jgi:hypothetical protein
MWFLSYVLLPVALLLAMYVAISMLRQRKLKAACEHAFRNAYASSSPAPRLEMTYSYSYPAFKVLFKSKPDIETASQAGLNDTFLRAIDELCKDSGPKSRPFSAEQAIFFTHEGYLDEMLNRQKVTRAEIGMK